MAAPAPHPAASSSSLCSLFSSSLHLDSSSSALNAAKLSSMSLGGSYEEFSSRVAAAHLKPLQQTDGQIDQIANSGPKSRPMRTDSDGDGIISPVRSRPVASSSRSSLPPSDPSSVTVNSFNRHWVTLSSASSRFSYLLECGSRTLARLIRSGGIMERLNEIITTIKQANIKDSTTQTEAESESDCAFSLSDARFVFELFSEFVSSAQFPIHAGFLTDQEKQAARIIMQNIAQMAEQLEKEQEITNETENENANDSLKRATSKPNQVDNPPQSSAGSAPYPMMLQGWNMAIPSSKNRPIQSGVWRPAPVTRAAIEQIQRNFQ